MMSGKSIGQVVRERGARDNNFDFVRLVAAFLVLVSHAFPLSTGSDAGEPVSLLTGGQSTLGMLAVGVFFFVSGFLVTESYRQSRGPGHFLWKRAMRLVPGLLVVVLVAMLVIGPAMTKLSAAAYWSDAGTWNYIRNAVLWMSYPLPGVFENHPYPNAVNGSLWTLPREVQCYLMLCVAGMFGLLDARYLRPLSIVVMLAVLGVAYQNLGGEISAAATALELFTYFAMGTVVRMASESWPVGHGAGLAGVALLAIGVTTPIFPAVAIVAISLIVPWLAYANVSWPKRVTESGDYSYGLYLYAFPVQQMVVALSPTPPSWAVIVLAAAPVTLVLAILSWRFVERPALALKSYSLMRASLGAATGRLFAAAVPKAGERGSDKV